MNKKRLFTIIFAVLTLAITVFIFSNSLQVGETSAAQSDIIAEIADRMLRAVGITLEERTLTVVIRKLAHFSEYFILGASSLGFILTAFSKRRFAVFSPIYCLAVAVCDEFIMQAMTAGRAPLWTDVLIDFSGVMTAFVIICIFGRKRFFK